MSPLRKNPEVKAQNWLNQLLEMFLLLLKRYAVHDAIYNHSFWKIRRVIVLLLVAKKIFPLYDFYW